MRACLCGSVYIRSSITYVRVHVYMYYCVGECVRDCVSVLVYTCMCIRIKVDIRVVLLSRVRI